MGTPWSEADSALFLDIGAVAVPEREAQIAAFQALVPGVGGPDAEIWELCSGEGLLSRALLEAHPTARIVAFDGSEAMRAATIRTAGDLADRLETRAFEIAAMDWRQSAAPLSAVVSSLAVHHLDGPGKARLFADMAKLLAPGGALLIADLVEPASAVARVLAARVWDQEAERRSRDLTGGPAAFERFRSEGWNFYADPDPDPIDQPSSLLDQLIWMRESGLEGVDVFWMKAGHALFGGFKPR